MRNRHFVALDSWRGICALLVCLLHFPATGLYLESSFLKNSMLFVDFFFVLSGFVIATNYMDRLASGPAFIRFMWLRVGRLYPLHLAVFLAYFGLELIKLILGAADPFGGDKWPEAIPTNLLLIHSLGIHEAVTWNRPSWSISCEMFAYLTFALVTMASGQRRYFAYATIIIASFAILFTFNDQAFIATHDFGFFRCLAGFFAGVFAWRLWKLMDGAPTPPAESQTRWTIIECVSILIAGTFVWAATFEPLRFLAPFIFAALVIVFSFERGAVSKRLQHAFPAFLGMLSYSIYMTHQFLIDRLLNVAIAVENRTGLSLTRLPESGIVEFTGTPLVSDLLAFAFLGLVVLVSWVTYRLIEVPFRDWFKRHVPGKDVANQKQAGSVQPRTAEMPRRN